MCVGLWCRFSERSGQWSRDSNVRVCSRCVCVRPGVCAPERAARPASLPRLRAGVPKKVKAVLVRPFMYVFHYPGQPLFPSRLGLAPALCTNRAVGSSLNTQHLPSARVPLFARVAQHTSFRTPRQPRPGTLARSRAAPASKRPTSAGGGGASAARACMCPARTRRGSGRCAGTRASTRARTARAR